VVDLAGTPLPTAVSTYLRGDDARDLATALLAFAPTATVHDHEDTYRGVEAIEQWMTSTWERFCYSVAPVSSEADGQDTVVVRTHLVGDFPGAEVDLDYRFTLAHDLIDDLRITLAA
jgi:hypothetical protein